MDWSIGQQRELPGVLIEEALVLVDLTDAFALLLECPGVGGSARLLGGGLCREDALEGLVGRLRQCEHPLARLLDLLDAVMACEVAERANGFLCGAAEVGEDLPRKAGAVRSDLVNVGAQMR